jgi:hypothetical protein
MEDLADTLEERLWVSANNYTGIIEFGFEWSNPDLAYDIVEAAIQSFLEARHASEVESIAEAMSILEEHASRINLDIAARTKQVEAIEREVRKRGVRPMVARPRVPQGVSEEAAKADARLTAKKRTLADLEDYRRRRVQDLQAQLVQQESVYAEQHPVVVATRRSLDALSAPSPQLESLRAEVGELERDGIRRGVRPTAGPREQLMLDPADLQPAPMQEDPTLEYERHKLWLLIRQHSGLIERIDALRVEMDTARAGFKYRYSVVTPPQMPKGPIKPKPARVLLMAFVGGLAFAVFAAVVLDVWSGALVEPWQVERGLRIPVLVETRDRS